MTGALAADGTEGGTLVVGTFTNVAVGAVAYGCASLASGSALIRGFSSLGAVVVATGFGGGDGVVAAVRTAEGFTSTGSDKRGAV